MTCARQLWVGAPSSTRTRTRAASNTAEKFQRNGGVSLTAGRCRRQSFHPSVRKVVVVRFNDNCRRTRAHTHACTHHQHRPLNVQRTVSAQCDLMRCGSDLLSRKHAPRNSHRALVLVVCFRVTLRVDRCTQTRAELTQQPRRLACMRWAEHTVWYGGSQG